VNDTGQGIADKDLERIFEPFFTKKQMGRSGSGLGLAVVWGTVKDHHGYIDVQSTLDEGTTFELCFPVTAKKTTPVKEAAHLEEYMGNGESILVVDDVKSQREISSEFLTKQGYSVKTVPGGEQAVAYMENHSADLVILDMIMDPGIDGLETYKQILKIHPGQKAIITSGFSDTKRVEEAIKCGAGAYIKKPFTFEVIGQAVKKELADSRPNH
jgi:two-component system cell cycle sensor histidine kinase/response regulator CckA